MRILGIHDGHNGSASLIEDGQVVYAAQEERFTNVKNQGGMPWEVLKQIDQLFDLNSIDKILFAGKYMGLYDWSKQNIISYYAHSDSCLNTIKQFVKQSETAFNKYTHLINKKRWIEIRKIFNINKVEFLDHHLCHASAAYFAQDNFDKRILVITADGEGDNHCGSVYIGYQGQLQELLSVPARDSLGRMYSYITFLYNMVPYEHEYKIMGLAPYCTDRNRINACKHDLYKIINFEHKNSLQWKYLGSFPSIQSAGKELKTIFYKTRFDIMAAALQESIEEILVEWIRRLISHTGIRHIALSGGVFMNVKANMLIAKIPEVISVFVFPSCSDESNAIGAAYYGYHKYTGNSLQRLQNYYLGDSIEINEKQIEELKGKSISIEQYEDVEKKVAQLLAEGEIVGRMKGKMEFGARALGNRSILANPSVDGVLRIINEMIKGRDFWMPFAPSVIHEDLGIYFDKDESVVDYEYMIFTAESKPAKRNYARNALHPYDATGRPQSVRKEHNPDYYRLLEYYKKMTGESLILNTSYNLHGFPIARSQEQAIDVFLNSGLKYLAIENYLLEKEKFYENKNNHHYSF